MSKFALKLADTISLHNCFCAGFYINFEQPISSYVNVDCISRSMNCILSIGFKDTSNAPFSASSYPSYRNVSDLPLLSIHKVSISVLCAYYSKSKKLQIDYIVH